MIRVKSAVPKPETKRDPPLREILTESLLLFLVRMSSIMGYSMPSKSEYTKVPGLPRVDQA